MSAEATVGVNFVASTRDAVQDVGSVDKAMNTLTNTVKTLVKTFVALYAVGKIKSIFKDIINEGSLMEDQVAKLTIAFRGVPGVIDPAKAALEEYQAASDYANSNQFEVADIVEASKQLRLLGFDPLTKSIKMAGEEGDIYVSKMAILGDMSTMTGQTIDTLGIHIARAIDSGSFQALTRFGVSVSFLEEATAGLTKGTAEYETAVWEAMAANKAFSGAADIMNDTLSGVMSTISSGVSNFYRDMAGVGQAGSIYEEWKAFFQGVANWFSKHAAEIRVFAQAVGQVLGQIFKITVALFQPVISLFALMGKYVVNFSGELKAGAETAEQQVGRLGKFLESITLWLALMFGSAHLRIEKFWGTFKRFLDFIGLGGKQVFTMLAIVIGKHYAVALGLAIKRTYALAVANWRLMLGKAGMLIMLYALAKVIQNWNDFSAAAKVATIAVGILTGAVYLYTKGVTLATIVTAYGTFTTMAASVAYYAVSAALWVATIAVKLFGIAVAIATSPITLIVLAIAAFIAIVYIAIKNWDTFGQALLLILGPVGLIISAFKTIYDRWDAIKETFKTEGIVAGFKSIGGAIKDGFSGPFIQARKLISEGVDWFLSTFPEVQKTGSAVLGALINVWNNFGKALTILLGPAGAIINVFRTIHERWNEIRDAFKSEGILAGLKAIGAAVFEGIVSPFVQAGNAVKLAISTILNTFPQIKIAVLAVVNDALKIFENVVKAFKLAGVTIAEELLLPFIQIKEIGGGIIDGVTEGLKSTITGLKTIGREIKNNLLNPFTRIIFALRAVGSAILGGLVNPLMKFYDLWSGMNRVLGMMLSPIEVIIEAFKKLYDKWGEIKETFVNNGIVAALKAIGDAIYENLVRPFMQAYEWAQKGIGAIRGLLGGSGDSPADAPGEVVIEGRSAGGRVNANTPYVVGEKGPELLIMGNQSGNIIPNDKMGGGKGGGVFNITINVDAKGGGDPQGIANAIENKLRVTFPEMVRDFGFQ